MATPIATAFVRLRPDTKGFGREVQSDFNKASPAVARAGQKQGSKFSQSFKKGLGGSRFSQGLAASLGLATGVAIAKFGRDSVAAFKDAQVAQAKLSYAFARFPKLADSNVQAFKALNTELQK